MKENLHQQDRNFNLVSNDQSSKVTYCDPIDDIFGIVYSTKGVEKKYAAQCRLHSNMSAN